MTHQPAGLRFHVSRLLAVLDEEIELLDLRRSQLEALSAAIAARDDARMEALLDEIQRTLQRHAGVDLRLTAVRTDLGSDLGFASERVRLPALGARLPEPERTQVESRRGRIVDLVGQLRRQHLQTSILLTECARANRLLLEALFPESRGVETYSGDGPERWRPETGLVNAER